MLAAAVSRARAEALEEIYRRHAPAVYALACRLSGAAARAEAVVVEVFVDLWSGSDRFEPDEETLRSYLLARTYGVMAEEVAAAGGGRSADPSAWTGLSDDQRQAIELARFPGATYVDVAMLLERPEDEVKAAIRLGLTLARAE